MNYLKLLKYRALTVNIRPNGVAFALVFNLFRALFRLGIIRHKVKFDYIIEEDFVFILTPLAGSSSIRKKCSKKLSRTFISRNKIYFLQRDDSLRMQSFYNKKVRNPDELGKCILLAMCPPLDYTCSIDGFIDSIKTLAMDNKDKHLFSNLEILDHLRIRESAISVNIASDKDLIEKLLNIDLEKKENTSQMRSSYQNIVKFSSEQRSKIDESLAL